MTTIIDALKGLKLRMCKEEHSPAYWISALSEIIAEHERSAEPSKLFYEPTDTEIASMLCAIQGEATDYDRALVRLHIKEFWGKSK